MSSAFLGNVFSGVSGASGLSGFSGTTGLSGFSGAGGGGGTPAGSSGEVQFNNSGSFGADSNLFWDNTNKRLAIGNTTAPSNALTLINNDMRLAHTASATETRRIIFLQNGTTYVLGTSGGAAVAFLAASNHQEIAFETHHSGASHQERLRIASRGGLVFKNSSTATVGAAGEAVLRVDGSGNLQVSHNGGAFANVTSAGAAGSSTQIQYNTGGAFDADANFTWSEIDLRLDIGPTFSYGSRIVTANNDSGVTTVGLAMINNNGTAGTGTAIDFIPNTNIALGRINCYRSNTGGSGTTDLRFHTFNGALGSLLETFRLDGLGSTVCGRQVALATNATDGFLYIPTCAGTPTGTPTAFTGKVAMIFDTTNDKLYIYDGSWLGGTAPGTWT